MVDVVKLDQAGLRGAGAYEYWIAEGNVGTVQDFLDAQEAAAAAQVALAEAAKSDAEAAQAAAENAAASLTEALSTIDVLDQTPFAAMAHENDAALLAQTTLYPITPSDNITTWGDSLTDGTAAGTPDKWTEVLGDFITGVTVNNQGVGGETAAQILVRIQAAAAGVKDDISTVWMGTNSFSTISAEDIVDDYADAATALGHTNYFMFAPHHSTYRGAALRVESLLRATYGAKAWRPFSVLPKIMQGSETNLLSLRRHTLPADVTTDGLHPNKNWALAIGQEMGRMVRAISGGAPYVHDDIVGIKDGDAAATAILTTRILGTPISHSIKSGNPDDVVRISPTTGALTRGAGAVTDIGGALRLFGKWTGPARNRRCGSRATARASCSRPA
jgi:lysophospholipase L1-like esterase